jgi:hypothetical protein
MLNVRVPRARAPLLESLESRTFATVSHSVLIHPGWALRVPHASALAPTDAVGPIPLTEFGPSTTYQGQEGGLYGAPGATSRRHLSSTPPWWPHR